MKQLLSILLVTVLTFSFFSTAFADFEIQEMNVLHFYSWREVVKHDQTIGNKYSKNDETLKNFKPLQNLIWYIGEDAADQINMELAVYEDGSVALIVDYIDNPYERQYFLDPDYFMWVYSPNDNKIHVVYSNELIELIRDFVKTNVIQ